MQRDTDDQAVDSAATDRIRSILSDLEEADFDRVDPPADLWERIEAAIAPSSSLAPKEPPSRLVAAGTVVEYSIDADDCVIEVGQSWADFARENGAPELTVLPPGRALWTYFQSEDAGELWRLLVSRVRALGRETEVPLRCDAPDARRWFDMTVTPEADGQVHFRCALVFEEARPSISLLDAHMERDANLEPVPLCSWCGRGWRGSDWLEVEELVHSARLLELELMPPISYGICESCREEMSAELLVPGRHGETST